MEDRRGGVRIRANSVQRWRLISPVSWHPGYVATVDGAPAEIYRAAFGFRTLKLSWGEHKIVFEYHPASLGWGAALGVLGLIMVVGSGVWGKMRYGRI